MNKEYLLDTNICIYFLKDKYGIPDKIKRIGRKKCFISEITLAELYFGACNSNNKLEKMKGVKALEEFFTVIPLYEILEDYGDIKSFLRKNGQPLEDFDLLIGATAVAKNLVMVTENVRHLSRIPNIQVENWAVRK
jgi:tRNA(fMet)-specific endonuclease VapC